MSVTGSVEAFVKRVGFSTIVEIAGAGIFCAGVVQLFHHPGIATCVVAGAAAFLTGRKLRDSK